MNNKDKSAYQGGKKNQAAAATIQTIGPLLTLAVKKLSSELSSYYCLKNNCLVLDSGQIKFDF